MGLALHTGKELRLVFTPHLIPMHRGILATCTAPLAAEASTTRESLLAALRTHYANEPFVEVIETPPQTRWVVGSNRALISAFVDERTQRAIVLTAIDNLLKGQFMEDLLTYELIELGDGRFSLTYRTNKEKLDQLEDKLGFRILMTDRHEWSSEEIVAAFYGQSTVEQAFKNVKNHYHLAITPEFGARQRFVSIITDA